MKDQLPPMPPNMGLNFYPRWEPITKVLDAIKRHGELPEQEPVSNCCEAAPLGEIFDGFALCSECKEQAEFEQPEEGAGV